MDQILFQSLESFFVRKSEKSEVRFADGDTGIRCRIGMVTRTVWASDNGLVPQPEKHVFSVSRERLADFKVLYVVSSTREINPDLRGGTPLMVDFIQDHEVFYYTMILEMKARPRAKEKRNWE